MSAVGMNFVCSGRDALEIPQELVARESFHFPELHRNSREMGKLSRAIKLHQKNNICILPFCLTVEAEALGAEIKMGDARTGPRVGEYAYTSMEELGGLKTIDFTAGRIKEVLEAIRELSSLGETVALNIMGPLTIVSSLINPVLFYKAVKKNRETIAQILNIIEDNIISYTVEAVKMGARIISYADSIGTEDIVGPRVYKDIAGIASLDVLKRLQASKQLKDCLVHVCGKTSVSLEKHGMVSSFPIKVREGVTYGEGIFEILGKDDGACFIGHNCMKRTPFRLKDSIIWGLDF